MKKLLIGWELTLMSDLIFMAHPGSFHFYNLMDG
jgi:hypothetical protein